MGYLLSPEPELLLLNLYFMSGAVLEHLASTPTSSPS